MRRFGLVPSCLWQDSEIKQFGVITTLTAVYLRSNHHSNMIHLYQLSPPYAAIDLGISIDEYNDALRNLINVGYCEYDPLKCVVWVRSAMLSDIGEEMAKNDKRVKGLQKYIKQIPESPLKDKFVAEFGRKYRLNYKPPCKPPYKQERREKIEASQETDHSKTPVLVIDNENKANDIH